MNVERLLKLVGPIHVAGGLLLSATGFLPPAMVLLESYFPKSDQFTFSPFFVSVFGPTVASWGLLFSILINQYFAAPNENLWRGLVLSLLVWAPVDSVLCIYYGFYAGALVNAVVFFFVGTLLLLARKRIP